jgi:ketosteroid isomerase-like protein
MGRDADSVAERNVAAVRGVYERWARGDFSQGDVFDRDVEFDMTEWPEGSSTRGLEGMRRMWLGVLSAWEEFRAEPREFLADGEHVVVLTHVHARGQGSGMELEADTATMWTLEDGKVVRLGLYWDTAKALQDAGLAR